MQAIVFILFIHITLAVFLAGIHGLMDIFCIVCLHGVYNKRIKGPRDQGFDCS